MPKKEFNKTLAGMVKGSAAFKAEASVQMLKVKKRGAALYGSTIAAGVSLQRLREQDYGNIDWFITLNLKDSKGRNYAAYFEFGHSFNNWEPGEVKPHAHASGKAWIPGTHFMRHAAAAINGGA